jgi:hypothetical protein
MNFPIKFRSALFILLVLLVSCKSIKPENPPRSPIQEVPTSYSSINIPIVIPLAYLEDNLNRQWGSNLFSDKGLSLGSGLFADLDVNRTGKISLKALDNNSIQVKIPMNLKGDLKLERKVFGQVLSTSLPFNENLSPEISFIPEIGKNWELNIRNLNIDSWGRSMKYNLLGFEIDLDPLIRGQLQRVMNNQMASSGLLRFDFKHMAEQTWKAFAEPYTIEQNGFQVHFYAKPEKLRVKQVISPDQRLMLFLGLEGEMFSTIGQKPVILRSPLPEISVNENTENVLDIGLPLVFRYKDLDAYLNQSLEGQQIRLDKKTVLIPSNLQSSQYGDKTLLGIDFNAIRKGKNEVKGKMYFAGKPKFDQSSKQLKFEDVLFDVQTANLPAKIGIRSKRRKIQNQIQKLAVIPLGKFLEQAENELQNQGYLDTDFASMRVIRPTVQVEGIYSTAEDVRIYVRSRGKMDVRLKDLK